MNISADSLVLAPLGPDHLDAIVGIEAGCAIMPWPRRLFERCLRDDYVNNVLLHHNNVVGFSLCSTGADEAHLQNIVIAADQQGQGWGRWLLNETVELLLEMRLQRIFLEVRASNAPAISLYEDFGFKNLGQRKDYYDAPVGREDAYVYGLELKRRAK